MAEDQNNPPQPTPPANPVPPAVVPHQVPVVVQQNQAPFNWNHVVNAVMVALVLGLAAWVWKTNDRMSALEDYSQTKSKFWKIHQQTKDHMNDFIDHWNEFRPDGSPKAAKFRWDLESGDE